MMRLTLCMLLLWGASSLHAQKKKIDYQAYDDWNNIKGEQISDNGETITYRVEPLAGDGVLHIVDQTTGKGRKVERGYKASVSSDGNTVVFKIAQPYDTIRQLKIKKVKKSKWPKDSLGIWQKGGDSLILFDKVKGFQLAEEETNWLVITFDDDDRFKPEEKKKKKCFLRKKEEAPPKISEEGKAHLIFNPTTGKKVEIQRANETAISEKGKWVAYIRNYTVADSLDTASVYLYNTATDQLKKIYHDMGTAKQFFFDKAENQFGFLATRDTGKLKLYNIYHYPASGEENRIGSDYLNDGWVINEHHAPYFSKNGERLFLYTYPKPREEVDDTIPEDEKATVDIWNYKDGRLQPQQLLRVAKDRKKGYLAVWNTGKSLIQIGDKETGYTGVSRMDGNGRYCLGETQKPYEHLMSWYGWFFDYYRIDVETGERIKLAEKVQYRASMSPEGDWFVYFSQEDTSWHSVNCSTLEDKSITKFIPYRFDDEDDDHPMDPNPHGIAGWTKEGDVIIYDKYDAWRINLKGEVPPKNITRTRETEWTYRYWKTDPEAHYINLNDITYWIGFDHKTKALGIASLGRQVLKNLLKEDARLRSIYKAKNDNTVILRTENFTKYPDLSVTDLSFAKVNIISDANPQQKDYKWGTVELVSWKSYEGLELEGLLYKPEDFDPTKKYPLMVYFYETYSEDIHYYYSPKPTASIIYPTEYISNGYIVFIPDIKYIDGHPAKSAYDCIVSGTDYVAKNPWIDTNRMALQGQSWGGYQTAMLVTMTDKYCCAMAGAPVSNMTSAYGGIRWGSGLSRMFQYEKTQTRLGGNLWDSLDVYIENSPIFHVPKVTTPLLIMHNDNDGAVPWYQGIEYFVSLRRLNKPAWMLNYNGDAHNLKKLANKRDLSRRMRQFFDHYMLGAPEPKWMKEGVPAVDKGIDYGFGVD